MRLHGYWRSTASWRVRIALAWKGLRCEHVPVDLVGRGGEQHGDSYRHVNPAGLVPVLELDDGRTLTQSMAIIEFLEAEHPRPALLPADPVGAARARSFAFSIAMEIHPVNNLRVIRHLRHGHGLSDTQVGNWMRHWMSLSFAALEGAVSEPYCMGDSVTVADVCLVAQLYNARRWELDMAPFPRLAAAGRAAAGLPAFATTAPERMPDAPPAAAAGVAVEPVERRTN